MLVTNIRKDRGGDHRERVGLAVLVAATWILATPFLPLCPPCQDEQKSL